jgi:tRNA threonylcarbamoyladenosine biosynthesis protein TsaB
MRILALDTSTAHASVAVAEDGRITAVRRFDTPRGRGAVVFAALESLRPLWLGLDRIAVGIGPGTYNGLRVACALAGSFQQALGIDIVAVPSVCLLDQGTADYTAVGDARGGRIYHARVREGRLSEDPSLMDSEQFRRFLDDPGESPVFRIGDIPGAESLPPSWPDAAVLALLACDLPPSDPGTVSPIYLKPPHITVPRVPRT